jgi:excisionase family DNA binding protein
MSSLRSLCREGCTEDERWVTAEGLARKQVAQSVDERPQSMAVLNFSGRAVEAARMTPTATLPRNDRRLVFTSSQAARYLGVSLATIRRWTDAGHISCYRTPGGQRRFAREQLDVFVTSMYRDGNSGDEDYGNGSAHVHGASAA